MIIFKLLYVKLIILYRKNIHNLTKNNPKVDILLKKQYNFG